MNKTYKPFGLGYHFSFLFLVFLVVVFPIGLLRDAIDSGGILYIILTTIISLFSIYVLFAAWQNLNTKIVVSDEIITIDKPFKKIEVNWNEILEFGKYKSGYYPMHLRFYFKVNKSVDERIEIGVLDFEERDELISTIFNKAQNAKFVTLENTSWIPFVKHIEILQWNQNEKI